MKSRVWNSFKIACSMYSKIPVPPADWTKENKAYVMCFFPWVGAVIGALTLGVYSLKEWMHQAGFGFPDFFFTALLVMIPVWVTGGIHLDGYLDTQDALHSYQSRERKLEILKDPHTGAFAVIAGICYFVLDLGIYSGLTPILGGDIAGFLVLFPAALCWLIGWYKPYGMHTEKFIRSIFITTVLAPAHRKYKIRNRQTEMLAVLAASSSETNHHKKKPKYRISKEAVR